MNDTNPKIQKLLDNKYAAMTPEERAKMGFSMYDFAKLQVISSIKQANPTISELDLKKQVFTRFYENDFEPKIFKLFLNRIK